MTDFNSYQFGFIGLGLIGGSIAKSIRRYWPDARIVAYNPSADSLSEALSDGVVNAGKCRDDGPVDGRMFENCDLVFLCAPVQKNAENLAALRGHLKATAILTDIGSTKRDILQRVKEASLGRYFVGGHPMTGSERTRYRNSDPSLLTNAYYVIAPSDEVRPETAELMREFVEGIHAIPIVIDSQFHDYAVAGISHLPQVMSSALVNVVKKADRNDIMHTLAAGGFRDSTRIAASSPDMWEQICLTNGDNIVRLLDEYLDTLRDFRDMVAQRKGSELHSFFESASEYRKSFGTSRSGARDLLHLLYVDIEDRPGTLAEVVTLLAVNAVSIKNIAITHNREYENGSLRVEFYSAEDLEEARDILRTRSYTIYG